ncbi:hypothetical protein [Myroides sp. WP-1]|nr:hypothetical protein [Myroides sp. WP-1]
MAKNQIIAVHFKDLEIGKIGYDDSLDPLRIANDNELKINVFLVV